MSYALLTVDRGDRKPLYDHCIWQASRFVAAHEAHIQIIRPPKSDKPDLTERMKEGYEEAKALGIDWCIVMESDDYYAKEYTHQIMLHADKADFIGSEFTYYLNLRNRTWERTVHPNHSSLFCTAFRVSAMKDFKWHLANKVFLDIDLWKYAKRFRRTFCELPAIGIKGHGQGMVGGKGHIGVFPNKDPDLAWVKKRVDETSFKLYESLSPA